MNNNFIYDIAKSNPNMTDIDRLVNLYWALSSVLTHSVPGAIVEIGCNQGKTSVFFQMIIDHFDSNRELHLFDSFQGLPEPGAHDEYLNKGDCKASIEDVYTEFSNRNLKFPFIHSGWFEETFVKNPFDQIAFAYIDCDFYQPVLNALNYIYPALSKNSLIIIDDYGDKELNPRAWLGLPGVKIACDEFIADKPEKLSVLVGNGDLSFALLRKL